MSKIIHSNAQIRGAILLFDGAALSTMDPHGKSRYLAILVHRKEAMRDENFPQGLQAH